MHRFVYAAAVVSLTAAVTAQSPAASADESRELRVLFVGHDPEAPKVAFRQLAKPRTFQLYRERTAAFEALLRYHFENVTVVHGEDYLASMSDDYDVTVFDTRPKPIRPQQRKPVYRPANYLPDSFDRPALLIAENSPWVGETFGSKFDWL